MCVYFGVGECVFAIMFLRGGEDDDDDDDDNSQAHLKFFLHYSWSICTIKKQRWFTFYLTFTMTKDLSLQHTFDLALNAIFNFRI